MSLVASNVKMRMSVRVSVTAIIAAILMAATSGLVLYPLAVVLADVFFGHGAHPLAYTADILLSEGTLRSLGYTLLVVSVSVALSLLLGGFLAWINERSDARIGWVGRILPLMPLLVPQVAGAVGWVLLMSPRAGLLTVWTRDFLSLFGEVGRSGPFDIFSLPGLLFVMTLYQIPYAYLILSAALQNMDPALEEAARIAGSGPRRTFLRITLPAIRPAIFSALFIVSVLSFVQFSIPVIIGTGAGIELLSVNVYRQIYNTPPNMEAAVIISVMMFLIVIMVMSLKHVIAPRAGHAGIGGKASHASRVRLGPWRWPAHIFVMLFLLLSSVLPLLALIIVSLEKIWLARIPWDRLTMQNYVTVLLENSLTSQAFLNSILLGSVGATLTVALATIPLLWKRRNGASFSQKLVSGIMFMPAAMPHSIVGISFILAFAGWPFQLYGTLTILLMAYILMFLPQASQSGEAALAQVGTELTDSAQVFGAGPLVTLRRVLLPLMLPGLVAGWVIVFVLISGEVTASALLGGTANPVVGLALLNLWENGSFPQVATMAVVITFMNAAVVTVVLGLARRARSTG
jgi:iron(III) transport system permease protein